MRPYICYVLTLFFIVACKPYKTDEDGITLSVKEPADSMAKLIRVDIITDNIIHFQAFPNKIITPKNSLVVLDSLNVSEKPVWNIQDKNGELIVSTTALNVTIQKSDGRITILDKNNKILLADRDKHSTYFKPKNIEGNELYKIQKIFNSDENEAYYGLGQHQNGQMNYKGEDLLLIQHNIVAVVPFLVSNKNYGILWDNYSLSKFGDPREYKPMSILKLYDEKGIPGGLTAKYYNTRDCKTLLKEQIENSINYKYVTDQDKLPEDFNTETGIVKWKGYIAATQEGLYKFQSYVAGYNKIWIDGKLVIDCWRQCWNPWNRKFTLYLEENKQIPVEIEWIPDGEASYFAFECLTPYDKDLQQQLCLTSEAGKSIDYYFIAGNNIDEVVSGYRTLTGKAPIMPKWAMGLWQSRERYKTQEELLHVVKAYRKRQIPLDNIVLDWHYWEEDQWGSHSFEQARFPDPEGMIEELHNDLHAKIMISVWPKYYENTRNYKLMKENGWLYMENINNRQKDWVGPGYISTFYDAFNKDARRAFWSQLNDSLFMKGIDAWWLDATEPDILSNTSYEDRLKLLSTPALGPAEEYYNAYSLMNSKGVYEGQRVSDPNKRVFILTRSAFAGQQRYATATWSGDVASRWSDLKEQIPAGLNFCISGIPYWTHDIGGFSLEKRYEQNITQADLKEWRELNVRWFQFGAFTPLFRIHGQFPYREIFNLAPSNHPAYKTMVYYDKLRYALMPYIYTVAGMTYHNDYTIMRPLIMDFAADEEVINIADEYMFGPNLLVCPVYTYLARERKVYLPASANWYDLLNGEFFEGGKTYTVEAPLEKIPVFVREGAIIPTGPDIQNINEKLCDPITIYVFAGKNGEFTLYEDEGTNYDYEQGLFSNIKFDYNEENKTLKIGKREGHFPGMLMNRSFVIKIINPNTNKGLADKNLTFVNVAYSGKPVEIKLID